MAIMLLVSLMDGCTDLLYVCEKNPSFHFGCLFSGVFKKLAARPSSVLHNGAVIDVEAMRYDDYRSLLGYVLYYKEAPFTNVSVFVGRDTSRKEDGWQVEDITTIDRKAPTVQIPLTNLKPYTQYAYYVKTYTIVSEPNGGQSDILYFRTKPWQPGTIQKMKVLPNGSSSIVSL